MDNEEFPFQAEFEEQMRRAREQLGISVGDIYEDCSCHPVLCVSLDYEQDDISGISLIDGPIRAHAVFDSAASGS